VGDCLFSPFFQRRGNRVTVLSIPKYLRRRFDGLPQLNPTLCRCRALPRGLYPSDCYTRPDRRNHSLDLLTEVLKFQQRKYGTSMFCSAWEYESAGQ